LAHEAARPLGRQARMSIVEQARRRDQFRA
jgi:hypothetical protein